MTTLCGSLSRYPVALGAAMHNAGYRALGLDFHYLAFRCEDLAGALSGMRALGIRGFGVSMPFKLDVVGLCDALDPMAQRIGAVNTVVNDGGRLTGHNTDWLGATRALGELGPLHARAALVLGAGGAARAVAIGLSERGAAVTLTNRTEARGRALAASLELPFVRWEERARARDFDVVVNASSCGMSDVDPASPLPSDALRPGMVVLDAVYKPLRTELLLLAQARGAIAIDGSRMLLHQAAAQFALYTGREAPLAAMDAALREAL